MGKMGDMKKPECILVGTNGMVFSLVYQVCKCLRENYLDEQALKFGRMAHDSDNYHDVFSLASRYVVVIEENHIFPWDDSIGNIGTKPHMIPPVVSYLNIGMFSYQTLHYDCGLDLLL